MLTFSHLSKTYPDGTEAVVDFNLEVQRGELVALIGPSGCGKSTTLRMVNRLIEPSAGTIEIDGKDYYSYKPVQLRRKLGYVIQQVGLIPHMTIAENISFVLRLQNVPQEERRKRAVELASLVGMDPELYLDRYPRELSGGQQQRIGVLRALAHDPDIILMDEPFGALDPITREQLQDELRRLQRSVQKTIIFVTHDMDEALKMADRIVLMRSGQMIQVDTPEEMLRKPANEFVSRFIGKQRFLRNASEVTVEEVMVPHGISVPSNNGLAKSLEVMRRSRVDSLIVVDDQGHYEGMATLNAVQQALSRNDTNPIRELAGWKDVYVAVGDSVINVIHYMLSNNLDIVPVLDDATVVCGVVTRGALVNILDDAISAVETDASDDTDDANDQLVQKIMS